MQKMNNKHKPLLVNVEMAKAIQSGIKTQTRRLIHNFEAIPEHLTEVEKMVLIDKVSKYVEGDTLWLREPARVSDLNVAYDDFGSAAYMYCNYLSDNQLKVIEVPERFNKNNVIPKWISNRQGMPNGCIKELARTFLKITNVRIEKLQDISEEDCQSEGITEVGGGQIGDSGDYGESAWMIGKPVLSEDEMHYTNEEFETAEEAFESLWDTTTDEHKWETNPYVLVYEFELIKE